MSEKKVSVAYFSATGVTKNIAEKLADSIGADLYEIKPAIPYSDADLNWMDKNSRSSVEMKDKSSRPEVVQDDFIPQKYDVIFLGFPIWWYVAPHIVNNFLESYDFAGKLIRPFFTSGGSGSGQTDDILHKSAPQAIWRPAKRLYANNEDRISNWIKDIDV